MMNIFENFQKKNIFMISFNHWLLRTTLRKEYEVILFIMLLTLIFAQNLYQIILWFEKQKIKNHNVIDLSLNLLIYAEINQKEAQMNIIQHIIMIKKQYCKNQNFQDFPSINQQIKYIQILENLSDIKRKLELQHIKTCYIINISKQQQNYVLAFAQYLKHNSQNLKIQVLSKMENDLSGNNILEPIDPLNISFSIEKCKPSSNSKTQTPDSDDKNIGEFCILLHSTQQPKDQTLVRDPESFFGNISSEKLTKTQLLKGQKQNLGIDYKTKYKKELNYDRYQDRTPYSKRASSLKKQPFSQGYNSKINIIQNYQTYNSDKIMKKDDKKLGKDFYRGRMVSCYPIQPFVLRNQRKIYTSIDNKIQNLAKLSEKKTNRVRLLNEYNYHIFSSEKNGWKEQISEVQRLNNLIRKVDAYINAPKTPSIKASIANEIKTNSQRDYSNLHSSSIWKHNFYRHKHHGTTRKWLDQNLLKK